MQLKTSGSRISYCNAARTSLNHSWHTDNVRLSIRKRLHRDILSLQSLTQMTSAKLTRQTDDGVAQRGELNDAHDLLHEVLLDLAVDGARQAQEGAVDEGLVDRRLRAGAVRPVFQPGYQMYADE